MISHKEEVSTHSRPKAAGVRAYAKGGKSRVSTHSRPKAAGAGARIHARGLVCFNTQPPEGGWSRGGFESGRYDEFQHTAARRRLDALLVAGQTVRLFQHTAARRRLDSYRETLTRQQMFQHTAARRRLAGTLGYLKVLDVSFNTQPPEGGWIAIGARAVLSSRFQHTAARRRLG